MNNDEYGTAASCASGASGAICGRPKPGSSADLRVVNNDGPVATGVMAIAQSQDHTEELIGRLEHLLKRVLAVAPATPPDDAGRAPMETELNEALYVRLERQCGLNAMLEAIVDRIRL